MTTHPDRSQDVPMATTADHPAAREAARASRDQEVTARFVNDTLPHLNQLNDRARRPTHNAVDADDLAQETMLRAYAGFNTFSEGTNPRELLFAIRTNTYINGLHRAQRRPSEYPAGRQLPTPDRHYRRPPRSGVVTWHSRGTVAWLCRSRL